MQGIAGTVRALLATLHPMSVTRRTEASVRDVVRALEGRYPLAAAADWDAVGLVCGRPDAQVTTILFAVDPVSSVVAEAQEIGADLIVTHHPLFLHGVHSVAATSARGIVVDELIRSGIALYAAHTNADNADPGVSDALATSLGLVDLRPIDPLEGAPGLGTGRQGRLAVPLRLGDFVDRIATTLPHTSAGIKVAGDPEAMIETVGVCGGAGDSLLPLVTGLDAYVTSDLRHHRAQDHRADSGCALIDIPHWAGEWPWLPVAARQLHEDLASQGSSVEIRVSTIVTDPWNWHTGG